MSQPEASATPDALPVLDADQGPSVDGLPPGTAALLKGWFDAASRTGNSQKPEPLLTLPEKEARDVLEALLDHLRGALPDKLEPAGRAWGRAHRSASEVVENLSHLREILLTSSLGDRLEVHRALDRITAVATVEVTERIERVSRTDALTGVGNRRAFDETIQATLSAASRQGHDVTVVAVDLDGLKKINDTRGHAAGDAAIVSLVGALNDALRDEDAIFRHGGDEFVMVLPFTSVDVAGALMRRVAAAGAPSFTWGAAGYPQDGSEPNDLVDAADRDMYSHRGIHRATVRDVSSAGSKERWNPARLGRIAWVPAAAVLLVSMVFTLLSATSGPQILAKKPATGAGHPRSVSPSAPGPGGAGLAAGAPSSTTGPGTTATGAGSIPNAAAASFTEPLASGPAAPAASGSSGTGGTPATTGAPSGNSGGGTPAGGSSGVGGSSGGSGSSPGQPAGGSGSGGAVGTVSQLLSPVPVVGGNGVLVSVVDQLLTGQTSTAVGSNSAGTSSAISSVVSRPLGIG